MAFDKPCSGNRWNRAPRLLVVVIGVTSIVGMTREDSRLHQSLCARLSAPSARAPSQASASHHPAFAGGAEFKEDQRAEPVDLHARAIEEQAGTISFVASSSAPADRRLKRRLFLSATQKTKASSCSARRSSSRGD